MKFNKKPLYILAFLPSFLWGQNIFLTVPKKGARYLTSKVQFGMNKNLAQTNKLPHKETGIYCVLLDHSFIPDGEEINAANPNFHCKGDMNRNCQNAETCRKIDLPIGQHKAVLQFAYLSGEKYISYGQNFASPSMEFYVEDTDVQTPGSKPFAGSGILIDFSSAHESLVAGLRIRKKPSKDSKAVSSLKKGETVYILDVAKEIVEIDGKTAPWVLIETEKHIQGFVFYGYLKAIE